MPPPFLLLLTYSKHTTWFPLANKKRGKKRESESAEGRRHRAAGGEREREAERGKHFSRSDPAIVFPTLPPQTHHQNPPSPAHLLHSAIEATGCCFIRVLGPAASEGGSHFFSCSTYSTGFTATFKTLPPAYTFDIFFTFYFNLPSQICSVLLPFSAISTFYPSGKCGSVLLHN